MTSKKKIKTQHDPATLEKAFVNDEGKTTIICPSCGSVKAISAGLYRNRQHQLKVRCSCSQIFRVNLDFRQSFRKSTNLKGVYNLYPPASGGGNVEINNLSLTGICFSVRGSHTVQPGQKGRVELTLDNRKKTHLVREFIIRSVRNNSIGCEFRKEQLFEKELGFYLRFGP